MFNDREILFTVTKENAEDEYYELSICDDGRYWLQDDSGEGMEVSEGDLYKLFNEFFLNEF